MQVHNNEITVYRNESFTMNKVIKNRDGSPYIISNELNNPYFLITVSSSLYQEEGRYVYNKWLNLKDHLRFRITRPVNINELGYDSFGNMTVPHGFEGDLSMHYANVAVFTDGVDYKYWSHNHVGWKDYSCKINTAYSSGVTSKWPEQTNYYGILLVSGESLEDYLRVEIERISGPIGTVEEMYEYLKNVQPESVSHIPDSSRPIIISEVREILEPTKLYVKSNMKGAMI